ncbi:MAG: RNA polymerase sigma factor [Bacteroidia bacterium]
MAKSVDQEAAFLDLITQHQGIIHKVCRTYCDAPEERRDLFQEVVLQLWRSHDKFRGESKPSTWMYRIALNTAISGFRKKSRRPQYTGLPDYVLDMPAPEGDPDYFEKRSLLYQAIGQLSEVEKAVVMLYLEEKSYDEIAEIMGITVNYVGVKLNRIKTKLKHLMQPYT